VHEDIRFSHQLLHYLSAFRGLEVDGDASLVSIVCLEIAARPHSFNGEDGPPAIPEPAFFNLNDVRSEIPEHHARDRALLPHGPIDHPYALQGTDPVIVTHHHRLMSPR
jgi:hypothetical protein